LYFGIHWNISSKSISCNGVSLDLFIAICNTLKISPNYLLQDILIDNEVSKMKELTELWKSIPPSQLEIVIAMIQAVLKYNKD
jgi:hypothetical protein